MRRIKHTATTFQRVMQEEVADIFAELSEEEAKAYREFRERAGELCDGRSDKFLLMFLFARKLDVDRTLELWKKHLEWRRKYDVDNPDMDRIREMLVSGFSLWTPEAYDREGRGLMYIFPHKLDIDNYDIKTNFQLTGWMLDHASERLDNTRKGYTVIEDLGHMNFGIFKKMSKMDTKTLMSDMQDCLPIRMQRIYILNPPWYLKFMIALVKPFMKKKLRRRFFVKSAEQLAEEVDVHHLLTEAGGSYEFDWAGYIDERIDLAKKRRDGQE